MGLPLECLLLMLQWQPAPAAAGASADGALTAAIPDAAACPIAGEAPVYCTQVAIRVHSLVAEQHVLLQKDMAQCRLS